MKPLGPLVLAFAVVLIPSVAPRAAGHPGLEVASARSELAFRGSEVASSRVQADDAELEAEVREVASRLRCPTCRALSVYDSPSEIAREMQDVIRDKLRAGETPEEVEAYFVDRYGEWILLEPRASGFNWSVWLLPAVVLVGGIAFVLLTARRWVERGRAAAAALAEDDEL